MNSRFMVVENDAKEGKAFRLMEVATKRLSVASYHTRKSAKHAANKVVVLEDKKGS